jgi:hypothetical protein
MEKNEQNIKPSNEDQTKSMFTPPPALKHKFSRKEFINGTELKLFEKVFDLLYDNIGNLIIEPTVEKCVEAAKRYSNDKQEEINNRLDEIDEILSYFEDWMHGQDGKKVSHARSLIFEIKSF